MIQKLNKYLQTSLYLISSLLASKKLITENYTYTNYPTAYKSQIFLQ